MAVKDFQIEPDFVVTCLGSFGITIQMVKLLLNSPLVCPFSYDTFESYVYRFIQGIDKLLLECSVALDNTLARFNRLHTMDGQHDEIHWRSLE
jgi:hypothetical protein